MPCSHDSMWDKAEWVIPALESPGWRSEDLAETAWWPTSPSSFPSHRWSLQKAFSHKPAFQVTQRSTSILHDTGLDILSSFPIDHALNGSVSLNSISFDSERLNPLLLQMLPLCRWHQLWQMGCYGSQAKSTYYLVFYRDIFPTPYFDDVPSTVYKHFHRWKVSAQPSLFILFCY